MFKDPKGFTPENLVKAVLNQAEPKKKPGQAPEKEKTGGTNLLGGLAGAVLGAATRPAPPPRPRDEAELRRAIFELASQQKGVVTRVEVQTRLGVTRWEAREALEYLESCGDARLLDDRETYFLPEATTPNRSGGPTVGNLVTAASWAYGKWNDYQKEQELQERALLGLAKHKGGWFTHADGLAELGSNLAACVERLKGHGVLEQMNGKSGQPVYVVPQFLPRTVSCGYCRAEYEQAPPPSCTRCGAPLT